MEEKSKGKAGIAYLLSFIGFIGWVAQIILYYTAKDKFSKFHAGQAFFISVILTLLTLVIPMFLGLGGVISGFGMGASLSVGSIITSAIYVILTILAFAGVDFRIPIIKRLVKE